MLTSPVAVSSATARDPRAEKRRRARWIVGASGAVRRSSSRAQGGESSQPQSRSDHVNDVGGEAERSAGPFRRGAVTRPGEAGGDDESGCRRQSPRQPA